MEFAAATLICAGQEVQGDPVCTVETRRSGKVTVVVTGLGKDFLAAKAAQTLKVDGIVDLQSLVSSEAVLASPAYGVALMAAEKLQEQPPHVR